MSKKDLKKQYPQLDISLIDYLSKIDPSSNNKLLPFMVKMVSNNLSISDFLLSKEQSPFISNRLEFNFFNSVCDLFGGIEYIKSLHEFNTHLINNRIDNTDISSYRSWDDLLVEKGKSDIKYMEKELSTQVERVFEDETWLAIKPLSFKSSKIYGSTTKWCTTMEHDPSYFYRYSRGILIYVLNKKTNVKYGFYHGDDEYSVWNATDSRIDSLMTDIPFNILDVLRESLDLTKNPRNIELFSDTERDVYECYYGEKQYKSVRIYDESDELSPVTMETYETTYNTGETLGHTESVGLHEPVMESEMSMEFAPMLGAVVRNYREGNDHGDVSVGRG